MLLSGIEKPEDDRLSPSNDQTGRCYNHTIVARLWNYAAEHQRYWDLYKLLQTYDYYTQTQRAMCMSTFAVI